jgi:polyisoprenoid-binding protein YceI
MKKLILILFVQILFSQSLVEFNLDNSYISYDGKHPAHNWTGVSKEIQGSFDLNMKDLTQSKIDLYVPLFSFDSKNASRDSNMLDVVEEYYYPYARFTSTKIEKKNNEFEVTGDIIFHGIKKEFLIPVSFSKKDKKIIVNSEFSIMLTDFKVKRPSLLTIKIRDRIDIKVYLEGSI